MLKSCFVNVQYGCQRVCDIMKVVMVTWFPDCMLCSFVCSLVNSPLALQVMRRAQSNSPRIPPKKYHSFKETRDINIDNLLLLPGYKPRRPRPPSYPAHVSPSRDHLHVPRIRVTCVPDHPNSSQPVMRQWSPSRRPDSRGRSPSRRVSRRMNGLFTPLLSDPAVCAG